MAVVVKAFIRQLFGSPDVHMLEIDSESAGGIEELRQEISNLVDGRDVTLTWIDQDGDHIRLSTDKQLAFALKHGVKDNVLRVSVVVDWLGLDAAARCAKQLAEERRVAAREARDKKLSEDASAAAEGVEGEEASATGEDGETLSTDPAEGETASAGDADAEGGQGQGNRSYGMLCC